jgi:hypothetical protein
MKRWLRLPIHPVVCQQHYLTLAKVPGLSVKKHRKGDAHIGYE